jgi:hypothetical protein
MALMGSDTVATRGAGQHAQSMLGPNDIGLFMRKARTAS